MLGNKKDVSSHVEDCYPQGDYVTEKRVRKIAGVLDEDEKVHYLTRGGKVSVNDDDKGGTKGFVRAAFTDRRVVVKVPQIMGSDERTIPYDNMRSIDLDTGLITKEIRIGTGDSYEIQAQEPGKSECREIVGFVRKKMKEGSGGDSGEDSAVQKLKERFAAGEIDQEEFEAKLSVLEDAG